MEQKKIDNAKTVDASGCEALTSLEAPNAETVDASGCEALTLEHIKSPLAHKAEEFIDRLLCQFVTIPGGLCNRKSVAECEDCAQGVCQQHSQACERCGMVICNLCEESHFAVRHQPRKGVKAAKVERGREGAA